MSEEAKKERLRLRKEDGEIATVKGTSPVLAQDVVIRPMTYGDSRNYASFGEALYSWSDEDKIACLNRHVVEPEIHIEDVDDLYDNFDPWTIEDLMQAVFFYSGMSRLFEGEQEGNAPVEDATDFKPISA